jgi:predicted ATPase
VNLVAQPVRVIIMALVRMALTNYRCFASRQELELAPITVVLGKNNSGKSALVRAPLVVATGIRTDSTAPLDLDQLGEEILDSFTDLVHGGRPHGSIRIELELDGSPDGLALVDATVQHVAEYRLQVVSALRLRTGDGSVRLEWEQNDPRADERIYTARIADAVLPNVPIHFRGLLPQRPKGPMRDVGLDLLLQSGATLPGAFDSLRYLGPFRERPQRRYRLPASAPAHVGMAGENTVSILANDFSRQEGQLIRQVNESLAENLPGWRLDVVERGGLYAVALVSTGDDRLEVNLADTGAGVAQVLPIFVQRAVDVLRPPERATLEIVEQPELHLHPAAHASLADLYLRAVREAGVRFLIETHSETLLLRLRRRIAQGVVTPESVAVYFVENTGGAATARRIHIDEGGNLDYWPPGVFSEDYAETQALVAAQHDRADPHAG